MYAATVTANNKFAKLEVKDISAIGWGNVYHIKISGNTDRSKVVQVAFYDSNNNVLSAYNTANGRLAYNEETGFYSFTRNDFKDESASYLIISSYTYNPSDTVRVGIYASITKLSDRISRCENGIDELGNSFKSLHPQVDENSDTLNAFRYGGDLYTLKSSLSNTGYTYVTVDYRTGDKFRFDISNKTGLVTIESVADDWTRTELYKDSTKVGDVFEWEADINSLRGFRIYIDSGKVGTYKKEYEASIDEKDLAVKNYASGLHTLVKRYNLKAVATGVRTYTPIDVLVQGRMYRYRVESESEFDSAFRLYFGKVDKSQKDTISIDGEWHQVTLTDICHYVISYNPPTSTDINFVLNMEEVAGCGEFVRKEKIVDNYSNVSDGVLSSKVGTDIMSYDSALAKNMYDIPYMKTILLDCGRKYFSVTNIKKLIDNMSAAGLEYLVLMFGTNQGFRFGLNDMSFEANGVTYDISSSLGDGIIVSISRPDGSGKWLSESDMDEIIEYAGGKGISIIPEIDMPSHMGGILKDYGYFKASNVTLDIRNEYAVDFALRILEMYLIYFKSKGIRFYSIGGDEMSFAANDENMEYYARFINRVAHIVESYGMVPLIFNDYI